MNSMKSNKIKKSLSLPIIIILIFSSIFVFPGVQADSAVMICNYVLDSPVLIPGDNSTLTLTIINTEKTAIKTVSEDAGGDAYYDPDTGKLHIPQGSAYIQREISAKINNIWIHTSTPNLTANGNYENVGEIAPASSFTITFQIHANKNLSEGIYFPEVGIDVEGGSNVHFPIPIEVSSETVELLPTDVPSKISVNGVTDITFTIVNKLSCPVKNVMVDLSDNDNIDVSPNSIFVGILEAYSSKELVFSLKPSDIGKKTLSVLYQFKNSDKTHQKTIEISTEVIDVSDVEPLFHNMPSVITRGETAEIDLEVFNAKTSTISGVIVVPISDVNVFPSKYFIGKMNTDDVYSAHFVLKTDNLEVGEHTIGFKVIFKQGTDIYETDPITMDYMVTDGPNELSSLLPMLPVYGIILFFVMLLLLYFFSHERFVKIWSKLRAMRRSSQ